MPASARAAPAAGLGARLAPIVLEALAAHGTASAVALALADATASLAACRRVSLGVRRDARTALLAISGETRPDARRALTRALERRMTRALTHGAATAATGAAAGPDVAAAGGLVTCAVVREAPGGVRVVILLERDAGEAFDEATRAALERELGAALALVGVIERGTRGTVVRFFDALGSARDAARRGRPSPHLVGTVALATAVAVALAVAALVPLPYSVGGRVVIEASDRQVLSAPRDGHIRSAHARAGERIVAGELLASLDERELALAHDRWDGEMAKNRAEQGRALAVRDRAELARLRADAVRIAAELALVAERRARGELRAPFDGVVLSGDPTRSLGAPVEAGEVLFEVASGARRSLLVEVDEHDVALVEPGDEVRVRLSAEPGRVRRATLESLLPVAVAEPGGSVFRVPATLLDGDADGTLRPGMQGVARIAVGRRTLLDAWTRRARERLLLVGWKLGLVR